MIIAKFVGASGKVIAVEASPHNYDAAVRNIRLNGAANVEVINAAVSDTSEPVEFNCRANGQVDDGSGAWGKIAVPSISVDELTRRYGPPDVLFVDVEGFESKVMKGAADTLSRHRPDCFFEMHVGCGLEKFDGSVKSITDSLRALGYSLWMSGPGLDSFIPFSDKRGARPGAILPHRNTARRLQRTQFDLARKRSLRRQQPAADYLHRGGLWQQRGEREPGRVKEPASRL